MWTEKLGLLSVWVNGISFLGYLVIFDSRTTATNTFDLCQTVKMKTRQLTRISNVNEYLWFYWGFKYGHHYFGSEIKTYKEWINDKIDVSLYMPKIISKFWWNFLRQITYFHGSEGREYWISLDDSESVWELCCTDSLGLCWGQHGRLFSPTLNALNDLIYF